MLIIGCDPGLTGAISLICSQRGLLDGSIPNGPLARSYGFAAVVVVERRVVEYFDFSDGPLPATIARGFAQ